MEAKVPLLLHTVMHSAMCMRSRAHRLSYLHAHHTTLTPHHTTPPTATPYYHLPVHYSRRCAECFRLLRLTATHSTLPDSTP